MTPSEFSTLIGRLEPLAEQNLPSYRRKVGLLALLGNLYLTMLLLLVCGLLAALIACLWLAPLLAFKPAMAIALFLWVLGKALWIRLEPPPGIQLQPTDAPKFFALLRRLETQLQAPTIDLVLITEELNANVSQLPRLGLFGWNRVCLRLGLPLLHSLSTSQLEAVLAHELGHLAGDRRFRSWIYHQRQRWFQISEALEHKQSRGRWLFKPFLDRFVPYFNAYTFPLARADEYLADASAARINSAQALAEALTNLSIVYCYQQQCYWPQRYQQADNQPEPNFLPYQEFSQYLNRELTPETCQIWLMQVLAQTADPGDTHPTLSARCQALHVKPTLALPALDQSAAQLLGEQLDAITSQLDRQWHDANRTAWQHRYQAVQQDRQQLAELDAYVATGERLDPADAYHRARLTELLGNPDAALAQFQELYQRQPELPLAGFGLGCCLLKRQDAQGISLLKQVMQADDTAILLSSAQLRDYYWRQADQEQAQYWHQRWQERSQLEAAAQQERSELSINIRLEPHQLNAPELEQLRALLASIPQLQRAYLVRKKLKYLPERPLYILAHSSSRTFQRHNQQRSQQVQQQLLTQSGLPGHTQIFSLEQNPRFGARVKRIRTARVW